MALYRLIRSPQIEVVGLLTTVRKDDRKINIHETEESDLNWQAKQIGLPLYPVFLPHPCPNTEYLRLISETLAPLKKQGVTHLAFGDLFLEDIRKFREENFGKDFQLLFPLWGENTAALAKEIIQVGIKARVVAVDEKKLSRDFIGQTFDESFLKELPKGVDPCGENGEFHTFVFESPDFTRLDNFPKKRLNNS